MAPEQIVNDPESDARADIYSVGVLGYELLTGSLPFAGDSREEILAAHQNVQPAPLTERRADVPPDLAELVMKSLEKNPADRWQSAEEMVQRLDRISRSSATADRPQSPINRWTMLGTTIVAAAILTLVWRPWAPNDTGWLTRWANAQSRPLTDFPGAEVDAAISRDGQRVIFLADRDSVFDAFVTRIGSEQFVNLTNGHFPQLLNEDVRNVGFNGDGSHAWLRIADINSPASVWTIPLSGGLATPFLKTAVTVVWSPDNKRIVYHETTPGDPIFVANADGSNPRKIFSSEPGVHSHYVTWSPDARFIYFSHGLPPDEMDIWRVHSDGQGNAEQITKHNSRVGYPVLLDNQTLAYTATAEDGTGPWLYSMDLRDRVAHRVSTGVEHYLSISASDDVPGKARRLVATVSNPDVRIFSAPITTHVITEQDVSRLAVSTARSAAPRFGRDSSVFYLASLGGGDGVWRMKGTVSQEIWKSSNGAVVAAPAVSPDGKTLCFPVKIDLRTTLHCVNADGTGDRTVAPSIDVRGAASWSPDGKSLAVAARERMRVRLFRIPTDGGAPVRLADSVAANPVWSPDGKFILYSGTARARSVPLKAMTPDGHPYAVPPLTLDRLGDSYRFLPDGRLVVKLGGFRRQDFWLFDLKTGNRRQLTSLRPSESLQRFDVSPDGKRILFERAAENSDVVLLELPPK